MRLKMFNIIALTLASSLVAAALPAAAESFPDKVRLGDVGYGAGKPFGRSIIAIADAKGFIADEFKGTPVEVEFQYFPGAGPAINEGFANNAVDFATYGAVPNVIGRASGLRTRLVAPYAATILYAGARNSDGIKTLSDLKGKRIALQKATAVHLAALDALKRRGVSDKEVTIVDLKSADQVPAFEAGSVDAIFGQSNLLSLAGKGGIDVIYNSRDDGAAGRVSGGLVASEDFLTKYPDAAERVLRGYARTAHWLADEANREEAYKIWTRSNVSEELLRLDFDGVSFKDAYNPQFDDFASKQYQAVVDFNREHRLIRNDVDLSAWFDDRFLNKALETLNLKDFWPRRSPDGSEIAAK